LRSRFPVIYTRDWWKHLHLQPNISCTNPLLPGDQDLFNGAYATCAVSRSESD